MQAFDSSFPMILNRALDAVMPAYRDLFTGYDLTEQQWRVMRVIWTNEDVTSSHLSERTLLSPPSLVSIIDRLVKKGFVSRVRCVDDRRQVFIVATKQGLKLQKEVTPKVVAIQEQIQNSVSKKEWDSLQRILGKITTAMQTDA